MYNPFNGFNGFSGFSVIDDFKAFNTLNALDPMPLFSQQTLFALPKFDADFLETALGVSSADNPSQLRDTHNWLSDFNGLCLKQAIALSRLQGQLFSPFGISEELFIAWLKPLVEMSEQAVAEGRNPDLVAQDNQGIEASYACHLKDLVARFTQPPPTSSPPLYSLQPQEPTQASNPEAQAFTSSDLSGFNPATCRWACEQLPGQLWLLTQLQGFQRLEWQYHSKGQTRLAAMKNLLRSLLQVITGKTFSDSKRQPYRKAKNGQWQESDQEYLQACATRLLTLLEHNAFDVRRYALNSPHAKLGACPWQTVPGSELYSVKLRYYPRPEGIVANGKTLYLASPMINRCEIFDLAPGKSVIEGMLLQGYDLYLVDYSNPGPDQRELGLEFYGKQVHDTYLDLILQRHPEQDINVMAYCMGGTLFMPYLARRIEEAQLTGKDVRIRQVVLMTTPVLFDDDNSGHKPMRDVIRQQYDADVMQRFFGHSNVPPQTLELGMHAIQPGVSQSVAEGFYGRAHYPGAVQDAAPFLHWLHSGTRFPARAHQEWIQRVFLDNEIWLGNYCLPSKCPELDGQPVNMDVLNSADLALFDYRGQRDPIAPVGSCKTSERWGRNEENLQITGTGLNRTIEKNISHIFVVSQTLLADFLTAVNDFLQDEPPAYHSKN